MIWIFFSILGVVIFSAAAMLLTLLVVFAITGSRSSAALSDEEYEGNHRDYD
ncbi:MAG: hypothetical protein MH252_08340 [Thermosynechococcaceae cyanobacterium MS004]|nr:hypothetical protein [Thermosynechococcaceae cyanobacterium MS004]